MAKLVRSASVISMFLAMSASLCLAYNLDMGPEIVEGPSNFDFLNNPVIIGNKPSPAPLPELEEVANSPKVADSEEVTKCIQLVSNKCMRVQWNAYGRILPISGDCCRLVQEAEMEVRGCFRVLFPLDPLIHGSFDMVIAHCKGQAMPPSPRKLLA